MRTLRIALAVASLLSAAVSAEDCFSTPFFTAVIRGETVELGFGDAAKGIDIKKATCNGDWSALHVAAKYYQVGSVRWLLDRGCDVNAKSQDGIPLAMCIGMDGDQAMEASMVLIDAGSDPNGDGGHGTPILHLAAGSPNKAAIYCATRILDRGAKIDARDSSGDTALHLAVKNPHLVTILVTKYGADVNAKNLWGQTPLDRAIKVGAVESARILRENGAKESIPPTADPNAKPPWRE